MSAESDELAQQVYRYALAIARGDAGLRCRGDVGPEDVAQDVTVQFDRRELEPDSWRAWTATATRNRLVDMARQRHAVPAQEAELSARIEPAKGPSAGVIARRQLQLVMGTLGPVEFDVLSAHLLGATNAEIAARQQYASSKVAASTIYRVKRKLQRAFPELRFDLEPQRVY